MTKKDLASIVKLITKQPRLCQVVFVRSSHPKATPVDESIRECDVAAGEQAAGADLPQKHCWSGAGSMIEAWHLATQALPSAHRVSGLSVMNEMDEDACGGVVLCLDRFFVAANMRAAIALGKNGIFPTND